MIIFATTFRSVKVKTMLKNNLPIFFLLAIALLVFAFVTGRQSGVKQGVKEMHQGKYECVEIQSKILCVKVKDNA